MSERKAVYYGKVELIPGVICDGYVLDDDTAVMSERGTAELLGMDQKTLRAMRGNYPLKVLSPFFDKGSSMRTNCPLKVLSPFIGQELIMKTDSVEVG